MGDVVVRPATLDDVPVIGALVRRAEAFDGVPRVFADEELLEDLEGPSLDLELDTRLAVHEGEVVGWSYIWHPPSESRLDRAELFGEVAPERRGEGIGRELLGWSIARARERLLSATHSLPRFIRVSAYEWLEPRARLYARAGFEAVRWHDELVRALDDLPDVAVPAGVRLVPWPEDRDEEIRDVRNRAFADHWGSTVVDADVWHGFVRGHAARPDLSVIAVDESTGDVIALCSNQVYPDDEAVTGRKDAWIANLATAREVRGRGIASALIAWSLRAFASDGRSHAVLEVDTDNPSGAARLYRNLGFEPAHRSITYELEVTS